MSANVQKAAESGHAQAVRAARLLRRFNTLDDDEAAELYHLIEQHGTLTALTSDARRTLATHPGDSSDLQTLEILHARLTAGAYTPELATILAAAHAAPAHATFAAVDTATSLIDHTLEQVSDLLGDGDLSGAEQQLAGLLRTLADAVDKLPEDLGALIARGLLDLWGDDPVWQRACGPVSN